MDPRIIKNEKGYQAAVAELEALMESDHADSEATSASIELLALLISKYEEETFPTEKVSPADVVRFLMEERGLAQKDLAEDFGSASRVSDFLSGRRGLSLSTIVSLNRKYHVPFELLIDAGVQRKPRGIVRKKKRAKPNRARLGGASVCTEQAAPYRTKRKK